MMQERKNAPFRFAMMNGHYFRFSLDYYLQSMKKNGFYNIDILGLVPHLYVLDTDDAALEDAEKKLQQYGLHLMCYTPGQMAAQMALSSNVPQSRRRSIEMMKKSADIAKALHASSIVATSGYGFEDSREDIRWGLFRDSIEEIADHAANIGIKVMLEPLPADCTNVIQTCADAARLIAEVQRPNLHCILDITTMMIQNETVDEYFDRLGDRVSYVHLSDGPGHHLCPGNGCYDLDSFMERLAANGYSGCVTFEIKDPAYLNDPDQGTLQTARWLMQRGLWPAD